MPIDTHPSDKTLEAVYNINSHAKKYAGLADKNYQKRKKATARANSIKKKALYTVKTKVLNQCLPYVENVEKHVIDGDEFLCLYFTDTEGQKWSYHQPANKIHREWLPEEIGVGDTRELKDFESTSEKEHSEMSLKESLKHIEGLGYSANDYLEEKSVSYSQRSYFVGWKYLD